MDTNCVYELQKLYKIKRTTPIFDPFPRQGEHYQDFRNHVVGHDCGIHIVGIEACRKVLQALSDRSLAHSSFEELLTAIAPAGGNAESSSRTLVLLSRFPIIERNLKTPVDWSHLNWSNTILSAILVFVATLIGNALFFNSNLIAALTATLVFVAMYVCIRINIADLLFSKGFAES